MPGAQPASKRLLTEAAGNTLITAAIAALVNGSPAALATIKALADAIGDDPTYAADIALQLAAKAPLASPAFTGTPTAPTVAGTSDASAKLATTAFVQAVIAALVGAAPQALDTLQEIDAQLQADEGSAAALAALVAKKVSTWQPSTAYTAGTVVLSPSGYLVQAIANFTSGASFNASNWTQLSIDPATVSATYQTLGNVRSALDTDGRPYFEQQTRWYFDTDGVPFWSTTAQTGYTPAFPHFDTDGVPYFATA